MPGIVEERILRTPVVEGFGALSFAWDSGQVLEASASLPLDEDSNLGDPSQITALEGENSGGRMRTKVRQKDLP